jgi:DNA-binding response OmpR family regulator
MPSVLIVTDEPDYARKLQSELSRWGFSCFIAGTKDKIVVRVIREVPQLVIVDMNGEDSEAVLKEVTSGSRIQRKVPVIALISTDGLESPANYAGVDDFVVQPYDSLELVVRANRLVQSSTNQEEILRCGALEINLANCEVRVKGKIIELTFKEYELLKFLAASKGRVFTREVLLNQVWGYDYFGGDRTVDVHIRRLRSKIEISGQVFIETVRNIGYRFSKNC